MQITMKKLFLLLAAVAMFAVACTEGGEEIDGQQPTGGPISVSQGRVNVDFVGGECELTVNAKCSWAATCSANWITIQTPEGIAGKEPLRFNVARNTESSERKTTITLKNDNYNLIQEIYVIQSAFTPGTKSDCVIYYTSSDGNIIEPHKPDGFGANIISNKYEDGQGTLLFDAPITSIGSYAFSGCTSLTSVTIPNSVTSIGNEAFYWCTSLTSVTIGNGVTSIGAQAFMCCYSLTSVVIPDGVTTIGYGAFSSCTSLTSFYGKFSSEDKCCLIVDSTLVAFAPACGKTSYIIPDSVTEIGYYAFEYCTSLTSVIIPDGVTEIRDSAFNSCDSLTSVTIGNGVTSIGNYAFYGCTSLTSVTIPDSVTWIGDSAFHGCTSLTSVTIPDGVTSIGAAAFSGCASLTSFYGKFSSEDKCCLIVDSTLVVFAPACGKTSYIIPDSVTEIGNYAFYGCTSLTSVIIPDSVTSIEYNAFEACTSLTSVTIPNSVTSIGYGAFKNCSSLTSVTIPDSVTKIGGEAFCCCTSLTSITIPDSVTSIGRSAFNSCDSLKSVTIPNNVTSIGDRAFTECDSLTSITIPDSVTSIGKYAFWGCTSLTSVTIGNGVTSIGEYAFSSCASLKEVYCKPITPPSGDSSMFSRNASGRKIYVPRASVDAYKSASYWSNYSSDIVGYDF